MRPDDEYYLLTDLRGADYRGDFYFCGRAGNGWADELAFTGADASESSLRKGVVEHSVAAVKGDVCICQRDLTLSKNAPCTGDPLHWVHHDREKGRRTSKSSAFWRVIGRTLREFYGSAVPEMWSSAVVWSNLYKLGPQNGGNPPSDLRSAQLPAALDLLRRELLEHRPRWAVFLTEVDANRGWFKPFSAGLGFRAATRSPFPYVSAAGLLTIDGLTAKLIVAEHPQTRNEGVFAESLIKAIAQPG